MTVWPALAFDGLVGEAVGVGLGVAEGVTLGVVVAVGVGLGAAVAWLERLARVVSATRSLPLSPASAS